MPPDPLRLVRAELVPELFDYQEDLARQMIETISSNQRQERRALLSLPTGAGKTRTAVIAVLHAQAQDECQHVVWLAPSRELVEQGSATMHDIWHSYGRAPDINIWRSMPKDFGLKSVWITTPQAVYSASRKRAQFQDMFDAVVFDEAHQLGAKTFISAVEALGVGNKYSAGPSLIGLSATPGRTDSAETEDLVELFHGQLLTSARLGKNPVRALQRRGVLSQLRFRTLGEGSSRESKEAHRIRVATELCGRISKSGRQALVFTQSIAGAIVAAEFLVAKGVTAQAVHSKMPSNERDSALARFNKGHTQVLTNKSLLATGYDCPAVADLLLLDRIGSSILFEQIVGRAARGPRTGGTSISTIWDFDDHLALHGLPKSYYRFLDYDWS